MDRWLSHWHRTAARPRRGYALVLVAVIMGAVALVSAGLLALAVDEYQTSDAGSRAMQARTATEGVLDLAAWQLKENIKRLPGNLKLPAAGDTSTPDATIESGLDLAKVDLQKTLKDTEQPWVGRVGFPTTKGSGTVYVGAEFIRNSGGIDEAAMVTTVAGPADQRLLEFLSDDAFAQRRLDYNYFPGEESSTLNLYAHGEITKGQSDIRTATLRKSYQQENRYYGSRERTRDDFSQLTIRPHTVESPHDLAGLMGTDAYPPGMDRYWSVSYPRDPANPGRKIKRIGLLFDPGFLGLEDPGDRLEFSRWANGVYQPPFATIAGPTPGPVSYYFEDPADGTTLRIRMVTDNVFGSGTPDQQYGFQLSGVRYFFDEEEKPAYFETPHPYDGLEGGVASSFTQTIWSPYNMTEEEAGLQVQPGGGTTPPVVDPSIITDPNGQDPNNIIQAMRLEFSGDSFLGPGDTLDVINANTGQVLATLTGALPFYQTPFATRVRANTPLGIQLRLGLDGVGDPSAYGYLVSAVEYVDNNGQLVRIDLPTQRTAHQGSLGSLEAIHPTLPWSTTVFKPTPPGGAPLVSWKVHFNRATSLAAASSTDGDSIRIDYLSSFGPILPPETYVSPNGALGLLIGTPGIYDIADLANKNFTLGPSVNGLKITPYLDRQGDYLDDRLNYGFWVDSISYVANNANDVDRSMIAPGTMSSFGATAAYTNWGEGINRQGEWWLTVPGVTELGIHFLRDQFRLAPGDAIDIYDASGQLIKTLTSFSDTGVDPPVFLDPNDQQGGVVGELLADPNLPPEINSQYGWVLVSGDTARVVLRGDGQPNNGYNGFVIDKVAYFANTFLGNTDRDLAPADADNYNQRSTGKVRSFGEVQ
ncbi:MAG: hypothetical protein GEEBNDBF_01361 [bacterium]|nr:hypothetical protein [bacterium]